MKTKKLSIGFAITGSFCTFNQILDEIKKLKDGGYNVLPIVSFNVKNTDTRFFKAEDFYKKLFEITGNKPVDSLSSAEPVGPNNLIDVLVVAPCTGNTLSKLANAVTDTPVVMVAKSHMRNNKPVVVGISTNDGLGLNMSNIGKLITAKNVYFIPFGQDNCNAKPKSLVADFSLTEDTILAAIKGEQLQPILLK